MKGSKKPEANELKIEDLIRRFRRHEALANNSSVVQLVHFIQKHRASLQRRTCADSH